MVTAGTGVILLASSGLCDVTLVRDGNPESVIVLEKKPTRSAQMGAFELQHHIKLITGAELPIVRGEAPADAKTVIRIGGENQSIKEEASVIRFKGNTILLTGGDTADYEEVDYRKQATFPPVNYHWKGSLFAVYDFLEDYCGVHFYGMDPLDTTYKKRSTLTVKEKDRYFVSKMDAFRDMFDDDYPAAHLIKNSRREHDLWKLRWRSSVTYGKVNHNTYSIYFAHWGKAKDPNLARAFKEKRHELFARGYEGKASSCGSFLESNYPGDANLPPQLCYTNPGTIDYYAAETLTYFRGGNVIGGWENMRGRIPTDKTLLPRFPGKPYFYPYEGNDTGAFCQCADCRKLAGETFSNTKFRFVSEIARKTAAADPAHPGVATLAYGSTLAYPDGFTFPEHVSVELCLVVYGWWHPAVYKKNLENYEKWVRGMKGKGPLTLWLYIYGPQHDAKYHFGGYKTFPQFYPWKMGEYMKRFAEDGLRGAFFECKMPRNFLETYVAAKLAYDSSLDPEKIIDGYFTDYYGDAGPVMKQFYREIEQTVWSGSICPKEWLKNPDTVTGPKGPIRPWWTTSLWSREVNWTLGSPERMRHFGGLIEKAQALVKTPEEKERLKRFIDIAWKPAVEGRREYDLYLKQKEIPPRVLGFSRIPDAAGGDPEKIDWSKAVKTEKWTDCNGNDNGSTAAVFAAADSKYLYLKFEEQRKPWLDQGLWTENVEFFFTADGKHPLYHFACGPKKEGVPTGYLYQLINDDLRQNPYDFQCRTVSIPADTSWTLLMAFPLNRLPLQNNTMMLDFFRMRHDGKKWDVSCWQPTYSVSGGKGMDSYGRMYLYPITVQEDQLKLLWRGSGTDIVKDPAASNGFAAVQDGNRSWYLSYPIPKEFPKDRFKVIIRYRLEAEKADYVTCGAHDWKAKKSVFSKKIPASEVNGKEYRDIEIGSASFTPDMSIYIGSVYTDGKWLKNSKDKHYLDFIRFEPAQ
ncbi:MAG: hypothetical protein BWY31_02148 [Lentisphaerae bacterium ADurb.Bin242]|nr:MAG: hypothetical protein BWY31_02148 [Lentisphaerae bacterium ADurb.Bin242]